MPRQTLQVFERRRIDPDHICGVLVAESDALLLIHRVYDFEFDGFQIIRRRDVTRMYKQESDSFYESIMRKEGLWKTVPKSVRSLPLQSWSRLMSALEGRTVVVENERAGEFCIGALVRCDEQAVWVHYFSPSGEWEDVRRFKLRAITSAQFGDRYSTLYTRHLPPRPSVSTALRRTKSNE